MKINLPHNVATTGLAGRLDGGFFTSDGVKREDKNIPSFDVRSIVKRETLVLNYQSKRDGVFLSGLGQKLHQLVNHKEGAKAEQRWKMVTSAAASKDMRWIDKNISDVGKLLEKMKAVAKAAQDESLDDTTRMAMQIELGRHQHELNIAIDTMSFVYANGYEKGAEQHYQKIYGPYEDSVSYQMMVRALERIGKGEEWNVAEIGHIIMAGDNESTFLGNYDPVDTEWVTTADADVPTVGEILRGKGRSLMSAEEATVSLAELEKQTENLMKFQKGFLSFIENNGENPIDPDGNLVSELFVSLYAVFDPFFKDAAQVKMGHRKDTEGNNYDERLDKYQNAKMIHLTLEEAARKSISLVNKKTKPPEEQLLESLKTQVQLNNRLLNNIEKPKEDIPEELPERPL